MRHPLLIPLVVAAAFTATACDNLDAPNAPVWSVAYDPGLVPVVDPARHPFPNESYRMDDGNLRLLPAPQASATIRATVLPALAERNAFGPQQAVHFGLRRDGQVPLPRWLRPRSPANITSAVLLVDVDPDSPHFGTQVTLEGHLDLDTYILSAAPELGLQMRHGGLYLAIATTGIGAVFNERAAASAAFARVRDNQPANAAEAAAAALLREPLNAAIAQQQLARNDIVAATLLRIQTPTADLDAMAATIYSAPPATPRFNATFWYGPGGLPLTDVFGDPQQDFPGRGVPGGIRHNGVAALYTGTVTAPAWAPFLQRQPFVRDGNGLPITTGSFDLEWSLAIPDCPPPTAGWPVVIAQHGLGDNRTMALAMAESMALRCMATIAIDAVGHGARARAPRDDEHNATGQPGPDGIGDAFELGALDQIFLIDPPTARANLIETAAGLVYLAHVVRNAVWTAPTATTPTVLALDGTRIGYLGQSMGAIVGALVTGTSRDIVASVINVGGGNFLRIFADSPAFNDFFWSAGILNEADPTREPHRFLPVLTLLQGVLAGADPIAFGPRWIGAPPAGAKPKHVLLQAARNDQLVSNTASAGLARAAGLRLAGNEPPNAPIFQDVTAVTLPSNVSTVGPDGNRYGAAFVVFGPAEHGFITNRCTTIRWNHLPPFGRIAPQPLENPIVAAQDQAATFLATALFDGNPTVTASAAGILNPSNCD